MSSFTFAKSDLGPGCPELKRLSQGTLSPALRPWRLRFRHPFTLDMPGMNAYGPVPEAGNGRRGATCEAYYRQQELFQLVAARLARGQAVGPRVRGTHRPHRWR